MWGGLCWCPMWALLFNGPTTLEQRICGSDCDSYSLRSSLSRWLHILLLEMVSQHFHTLFLSVTFIEYRFLNWVKIWTKYSLEGESGPLHWFYLGRSCSSRTSQFDSMIITVIYCLCDLIHRECDTWEYHFLIKYRDNSLPYINYRTQYWIW